MTTKITMTAAVVATMKTTTITIDFDVTDSGANLSEHLVLQLICTYNPESTITLIMICVEL